MRQRTFIAIIFCLVSFNPCPALAADWSAGVTSDYETTLSHVGVVLDPNLALVGVGVLTDSDLEGIDLAAGPLVRLMAGGIYQAAAEQVLPPDWIEAAGELLSVIEARPFLQGSLLWNFDHRGLMGIAGTGTVLFPSRRIEPTIFSGWYYPFDGGAGTKDFRTTFGVTVRF